MTDLDKIINLIKDMKGYDTIPYEWMLELQDNKGEGEFLYREDILEILEDFKKEEKAKRIKKLKDS